MWLPPTVSKELLAEREQFRAELEQQVVREKMLKVKDTLDYFNYHLRRIDDKLEMVRAANTVRRDSCLKPGYYAIIRWNVGAPPSVINIEGPNGEFVEPNSGVFDMLARNDMWDPANQRLVAQRHELARQAAERERERERAERQEELRDRVNAAMRTSVSMNSSIPWSQNARGRRSPRRMG